MKYIEIDDQNVEVTQSCGEVTAFRAFSDSGFIFNRKTHQIVYEWTQITTKNGAAISKSPGKSILAKVKQYTKHWD